LLIIDGVGEGVYANPPGRDYRKFAEELDRMGFPPNLDFNDISAQPQNTNLLQIVYEIINKNRQIEFNREEIRMNYRKKYDLDIQDRKIRAGIINKKW